MNLSIVHKDILTALEDPDTGMIVHQVNCQGAMNSGVAKALREAVPKHFEDYAAMHKHALQNESLLGRIVATQVERVNMCDLWVVGVFGQLYYGYDGKRYTQYPALFSGLITAIQNNPNPNQKIAIPYKIGCDRGGGDWEAVRATLEVMTTLHPVRIDLYRI